MSDYERYGDYNSTEDDEPKKKSPMLLTMRILTTLVCLLVIGILVVRLVIFSVYPSEVKKVYFNDTLTDYYNENGGDISLKTQDYGTTHDTDKGYFFCKHLILADEIDQVQITVRYKTGAIEEINKEYGLELDPKGDDPFTYRLTTNLDYKAEDCDKNGKPKADAVPLGFALPSASLGASQANYRYKKLVFDGVEFSLQRDDAVEWMHIEVLLPNGIRCASVSIYLNSEKYSYFDDYKLSRSERP